MILVAFVIWRARHQNICFAVVIHYSNTNQKVSWSGCLQPKVIWSSNPGKLVGGFINHIMPDWKRVDTGDWSLLVSGQRICKLQWDTYIKQGYITKVKRNFDRTESYVILKSSQHFRMICRSEKDWFVVVMAPALRYFLRGCPYTRLTILGG